MKLFACLSLLPLLLAGCARAPKTVLLQVADYRPDLEACIQNCMMLEEACSSQVAMLVATGNTFAAGAARGRCNRRAEECNQRCPGRCVAPVGGSCVTRDGLTLTHPPTPQG